MTIFFNRRIAPLLFIIYIAGGIMLFSQEDKVTGSIIISSNPMGALLFLDGKPLDRVTPCRLDDLPVGLHELVVLKSGYEERTVTFVIKPDQTVQLSMNLNRLDFIPIFDNTEAVIFLGKRYPYSEGYLVLPQGEYKMTNVNGDMKIDPLFPNQGLLTAANVALPTSVVISGLMTLSHFLDAPDDKQILDAPLITMYGVTLALAALDIGLNIQKARFNGNLSDPLKVTRESIFGAEEAMILGDKLLADGRLESALGYFNQVTDGYPDSVLLPEALYKSGKILLLLNRHNEGESYLMSIIELYPLPEYYDKACKSLADLYYQLGEYEEALNFLSRMYLLDPLFPEDEIEAYKEEILAEQESLK